MLLALLLVSLAALALSVYGGVRRVFAILHPLQRRPVFWGLERNASVQKQALALRSLPSARVLRPLPTDADADADACAERAGGASPVFEFASLPDDVVSTILRMSGESPLMLAAVCREWRRISDAERTCLRGRPGVQVPLGGLLPLLARSPKLRTLRLRRAVTDMGRLDRALLVVDQAPAVFRPRWFLTHFRRPPLALLARFRRFRLRFLPAMALYALDGVCGLWVLAMFWGIVCPFCRLAGRLRRGRARAAPPPPALPELSTLDLCGAFRHDVLPLGLLHHLRPDALAALRDVDLSFNNLGDVGVCMFVEGALRRCPLVESFDLSFTGFGADGMRDVAEFLLEAGAAGRRFARVALRAHMPVSGAARLLGRAIASTPLEALHLGMGEYAYAADFAAVADGIARNGRLRELELADCAVVEAAGPVARGAALAAAFAAVGACSGALERLQLSGPVFASRAVMPLRHECTPAQTAPLCEALARCGRLERLAVRDYGLPRAGPAPPAPLHSFLAAAAARLAALDVGRSQLPAAMLAGLAAALPAAPRLQSLSLHFLTWSAADLAHVAPFARAARAHAALQEVGLAGLPVQAAAALGAGHERAGRLSVNLGYAGLYSHPELLLVRGAGAEVCLIRDPEVVYSEVGRDLEHLMAVPLALHFKSVADCESDGGPRCPAPSFPVVGYFSDGYCSQHRLARPPYGAAPSNSEAPPAAPPAAGLRRRGAPVRPGDQAEQ